MGQKLGQHFLFDSFYLQKIVEVADISSSDTVLEIGAGHGSLTRLLACKCSHVIAVELDRRLFVKLQGIISSDPKLQNVTLLHADALRYDFSKLCSFKLVANIPYYITTPLIFKFLESSYAITSMTLTVQKEVAKRICAEPHCKDYGVLTIAVALSGVAKMHFVVPAQAFSPPPKVDSAVITIDLSKPQYQIDMPKAKFLHVVKTAFSQRRKTILNALKSFNIKPDDLHQLNLNPMSRAEELTVSDFVKIAKLIYKDAT